MEQNRTEEMEIDLGELIMALLYKWWIILLCGLALAVGAFCFAKFAIEPTYESTTSVYVISRQTENTTTTSDISLGTQLMKDIAALAKSRTVEEEAISRLGLDITTKQLGNMLTVASGSDTRFLSIKVTHTSPEMAQTIANTLREVVAERAVEVMKVEAVNVADYANLPTEKAAPSISKYTVLGGALGVFIAAAAIAVGFLLNDRIISSDDVEKYLKLSTLGSIPFDAESMGDGTEGKKGKKSKKAKKSKK
jgi:capsular polysaccharide biosynthesis protein